MKNHCLKLFFSELSQFGRLNDTFRNVVIKGWEICENVLIWNELNKVAKTVQANVSTKRLNERIENGHNMVDKYDANAVMHQNQNLLHIYNDTHQLTERQLNLCFQLRFFFISSSLFLFFFLSYIFFIRLVSYVCSAFFFVMFMLLFKSMWEYNTKVAATAAMNMRTRCLYVFVRCCLLFAVFVALWKAAHRKVESQNMYTIDRCEEYSAPN